MKKIGHRLALLSTETNSDTDIKENLSPLNQSVPMLNIPEQNCSINNGYLSNNFEFFKKYIYGPTEDHNCHKLFAHLNSCYICFSVFSQTMRDYIHKKNEISVHAKGVAK